MTYLNISIAYSTVTVRFKRRFAHSKEIACHSCFLSPSHVFLWHEAQQLDHVQEACVMYAVSLFGNHTHDPPRRLAINRACFKVHRQTCLTPEREHLHSLESTGTE